MINHGAGINVNEISGQVVDAAMKCIQRLGPD